MTNEEKTLFEALSCAGLSALPKEKTDDLWVKAIVKVTKCDNSKNYAIAMNTVSGKPDIIRDFGNTARIVKVEEVYPYYVMPKSSIPDLRNKQDIITYLKTYGYEEEHLNTLLAKKKADGTDKTAEEIKADKETLKSYVLRTAFEQELAAFNEYSNSLKRS